MPKVFVVPAFRGACDGGKWGWRGDIQSRGRLGLGLGQCPCVGPTLLGQVSWAGATTQGFHQN